MRYAMIMAGGAGTRLWPMSRSALPKQLLPLVRQERGPAISLLELAAQRLDGLVPPARRYICTAERYRAAVRAALPAFSDAQVLGEPVARDTVNAVGLTAAVLAKNDPDATFAVLTADHVIEPLDAFRARMDLGFRLVEADPSRLVTFSIQPTHAATLYGYVERGEPLPDGEGLAYRVARFVEKPDAARARAYIESGRFGWNSGMFVWSAGTVMECLRRFKPESYAGLMQVQAAWGTPRQADVLAGVYPTLPKISVDYAIMEPASQDAQVRVCTVLMDLSWLDVGSWPSYGQTLVADAAGNAVGGALHAQRALLVNSTGNLVVSSDAAHTVALLGCEDLIVVHTPDATLVMPRARAEELKLLHQRVPPALG